MNRTPTPLPVIFTDLDGTLLDLHTYDPGPAREAVARLQERGIPIVFCSSKTRAEQIAYRRQLGIRDPFIVENGAAIFIPRDYFTVPHEARPTSHGLEVIELGRPAAEIRRALREIRKETGLSFRGYHEMTVEEVAELTGLPPEAARRAMTREYSETIIVDFGPSDWQRFNAALVAHGLVCFAGGRFHTVVGLGTDKGQAVHRLAELYRQQHGAILTVGLGDSPNDVPMLRAVDRPFLVQRPDGTWESVDVPGLVPIPAPGPEGWCMAVEQLLTQLAL